MLGRVVNAHCEAIDGLATIKCQDQVPIYNEAPAPLGRRPIKQLFSTGVRAIDGVISLGLGQRIGIFASAGGGKSTLLGMMARGAEADVNVIVLIGERGREVSEFIEDNLGEYGLSKSIIVVATSDKSALERCRAAYTGTAIAEYFRDQGKHVFLMMDSITRYARALRDLGLALGEPPVRQGFPPSVFSMLPILFERAGNNDKGYITAVYTVLLEGEEEDDPIGEEVRSLLDGHIVLSRKLAISAHYPAIDILHSASRVMNRVVSKEHLQAANRVRQLLAKYQDIELLIQMGEYTEGADQEADLAVKSIAAIRNFLMQQTEHLTSIDVTLEKLFDLKLVHEK